MLMVNPVKILKVNLAKKQELTARVCKIYCITFQICLYIFLIVYDQQVHHFVHPDFSFELGYGDCNMDASVDVEHIKFSTVLSVGVGNPSEKGIYFEDSFSNQATFTCNFCRNATTGNETYTVTTEIDNWNIDQFLKWEDFGLEFFSDNEFSNSIADDQELMIGDRVFGKIEWSHGFRYS